MDENVGTRFQWLAFCEKRTCIFCVKALLMFNFETCWLSVYSYVAVNKVRPAPFPHWDVTLPAKADMDYVHSLSTSSRTEGAGTFFILVLFVFVHVAALLDGFQQLECSFGCRRWHSCEQNPNGVL